MKFNCIICEEEITQHNWVLRICPKCQDVWNKMYKIFMPQDEEYDELKKRCEAYVKKVMTGHSCGQECGGPPELYASSDCIKCFPDTKQHYRNASDMVIAWTKNWVQINILKFLFEKGFMNVNANTENIKDISEIFRMMDRAIYDFKQKNVKQPTEIYINEKLYEYLSSTISTRPLTYMGLPVYSHLSLEMQVL